MLREYIDRASQTIYTIRNGKFTRDGEEILDAVFVSEKMILQLAREYMSKMDENDALSLEDKKLFIEDAEKEGFDDSKGGIFYFVPQESGRSKVLHSGLVRLTKKED